MVIMIIIIMIIMIMVIIVWFLGIFILSSSLPASPLLSCPLVCSTLLFPWLYHFTSPEFTSILCFFFPISLLPSKRLYFSLFTSPLVSFIRPLLLSLSLTLS